MGKLTTFDFGKTLNGQTTMRARNLVYAFTNENVAGYMPYIANGAKSGLVVSASGDQAILASTHGVTNITAFDACEHGLYYTDLKINAMRAFEYLDFCKFFTFNEKFLDTDMYIDFAKNLEPKAQEFWVAEGRPLRKQTTFTASHADTDRMIAEVPYLQSREKYNRAKSAVEKLKIEYMNARVDEIPEKIGDKKYDFAVLSNICGHVDMLQEDFYANQIRPLLKNCKKVQGFYYWAMTSDPLEETTRTRIKDDCRNVESLKFKIPELESYNDYAIVIDQGRDL